MQAFLASAKVQGAFQPLPSPRLQLTQLDQCRIRDRSTIMARHLFADRGDVFADEQVGSIHGSDGKQALCMLEMLETQM